MTVKRRDRKNRILRSGESQRKDGRYAYKYLDHLGKPRFVYSWKLVPTDKTPSGKRDCPSLREKEKAIQRDIADGIDHASSKMTVSRLYALQTEQRGNVRDSTKAGRKRLARLLEDDPLGAAAIDSVRPCDAKAWAVRMKEKGIAFNTIRNDKRSLNAAFRTAIENDFIRKNPFDFRLKEVIDDDTAPKIPLTPAQEESLLRFALHDDTYAKYHDELVILLGTGLWVSELCGLTEADIDLDAGTITIDHQLLRNAKRGRYIERTKTGSGIRTIPMSAGVREAFAHVLEHHTGAEGTSIDGRTGFLFLDRKGQPKTAGNYETMFRGLVRKYDKCHEAPLPKVTPHTMRHTFCTRMANAGMNPKALQYIMGHSNITMTLDYYARADAASAMAEMLRLAA